MHARIFDKENNTIKEGGRFWIGDKGLPGIIRIAIKFQDKTGEPNAIEFESKGEYYYFLPTGFKFRHYGLFSNSSAEYKQLASLEEALFILNNFDVDVDNGAYTKKTKFKPKDGSLMPEDNNIDEDDFGR